MTQSPKTRGKPAPTSKDGSAKSAASLVARIPVGWSVPLLLALFLLVQAPGTITFPFAGDDYLFLQKTRDASFGSLWSPRNLAFGYYRPWSREFHYWALQHGFGAKEFPFHVASLTLWLAVLWLYFVFLRRNVGERAAAVATAGLGSLAAWGVLQMWIAGCQDLWMLAFSAATLVAMSHGWTIAATAFCVGALLSKETAATLPFIVLAYLLVIEQRKPLDALRRVAGMLIALVAWLVIHPAFAGRLTHAVTRSSGADPHPSFVTVIAKTALSVINLDQWPAPSAGWGPTLLDASLGAIVMALLVAVALAARRSDRRDDSRAVPRERALVFGALWSLLGWAPLLAPAVGWHAYYGLLGTMGAWMLLGEFLQRDQRIAIATVALLVVTTIARYGTFSKDWGSGSYQARAAAFLTRTRDYLRTEYPSFPPNSRIYLGNVPGGVGMVPGGENSPVLQFWYGDTTLQTSFVSHYRPRRPNEPQGSDYFFRFDSTAGWREETPAAPSARASVEEREEYAGRLWKMNRYKEAVAIFEKLFEEFPNQPGYAFNVGSSYFQLGDSVEAARWYQRAANIPGAPEEMKRTAQRMEHYLRP